MFVVVDIVLLCVSGVVCLGVVGVVGKVIGRAGVFLAVIPDMALNDVLDVS